MAQDEPVEMFAYLIEIAYIESSDISCASELEATVADR